MRFLSLFSGIEAFSVATHPLGWECVAVAEIEPFPCKVLKHHYPDVPNLGDITRITREQIEALGHIDLIVGGFPCQDVSSAGKRKGFLNDDGTPTRSGLFFTAVRICEWAGARFVVLENVPGLYSSSGGRDFAAVVGEMAGCEFDTPKGGWQNSGVALGPLGLVEWITLDAQYVRTRQFPRAVPQRRRRVFVVRDSGNWSGRPPLFLEQSGMLGNPPPSRKTREAIATDVTRGVAGARTGLSIGAQDAMNGHLLPVSDAAGHVRPAEVCSTLDTTFGDKMGLEDQHINSGAPKFVLDTYECQGIGSYQRGDVSSPLMKTGADLGPGCEVLCLSSGQAGAEIASQHATTLTALHEQPIVTYAIAGNIIGRADGNGGNGLGFSADGESVALTKTDVHAVAFGVASSPDLAHCLRSGASKADKPESTTYIAQPEPCICAMIPMGDECPICGFVAQPDEMRFSPDQHFQIRRLTPEECESLQGFPRGYTNVPGASDTTRYRALGNSMAANVMEYIATRIDTAVNYDILNP